jgi:chemotaxis-related protein WspB
MLLLTFHIGAERYAIEASQVIEVVPKVSLKKIPLAERYIGGVFSYRGEPVPVIDLCQLFEHRQCNPCMSTRIVLIQFKEHDQRMHILGLQAERITETITRDPGDFRSPGVTVEAAPFLAGVCNDSKGPIQLITTNDLLPESVAAQLFPGEGELRKTNSMAS